MKQYLFFILSLTIFPCKVINERNIIQGDIYIKLINVHSLCGLPDEKLEDLKLQIKNSDVSNSSESEMKLYEYFKILIKNDLFNKPHFKLKTNEGKIINVYTSESEYKKLSKKINSFDKYKEKISIKFEGNKIQNNIQDPDGVLNQDIYICKKIISIKKINGITDWAK